MISEVTGIYVSSGVLYAIIGAVAVFCMIKSRALEAGQFKDVEAEFFTEDDEIPRKLPPPK